MTDPIPPAHDPAPSLPDPATLPGFDIAKAWLDLHRPGIAAIAAAAEQPRLPFDLDQGLVDDAAADALRMQSPQRPRSRELPLELLLILTLAAAIDDRGGARPGAPGQLSLVHGWAAAELAAAANLLEKPVIADGLFFRTAGTASEEPLCLSALRTAETGRAMVDHRRKLMRQMTDGLMSGRGVIGIGITPDELSSRLSRLCTLDLRLPRPDLARVVALLTLLFPRTQGKLTPETIDALLASGAPLARLTPLELVSALHAPSAGAAIDALRRLAAAPSAAPGKVSGLADVAGQAEAVGTFRQLAADIADWRDGNLSWAAVPRSLILHGPPGTGKTLLANAFAAQTGLPLIATSFGECQQAGHMGDMLAALEEAVADALARAPSVFFLDELDGFSAREGAAGSRNASYMRSVITALLRQVDRLMATEGVVLIGATNDLTAIDPAIRRPGRFDRLLRLNPPNRAGLVQILRHHLAPAATSDDPELHRAITEAAARLVGTSGAAAAALARAALARARGDGQSPGAALTAELEHRHPGLSRSDQRRLAVHEAGHLLVGVLLGLPDPLAARLTPAGGEVEWRARPLHTRATALAELRMMLAGRAAEEVLCGQPSSSAGTSHESDLARATRLCLALELEWGMGDGGLLWHGCLPLTLQSPPWLRTKLDQMLSSAAARARGLIATHRATVEALADALLSEREIDGEALAGWVRRIRALAPHPVSGLASDAAGDRVIAFDPD